MEINNEQATKIQETLMYLRLNRGDVNGNQALVVSELLADEGYFIESFKGLHPDLNVVTVHVHMGTDVSERKEWANYTYDVLMSFDPTELEISEVDVDSFFIPYNPKEGLEGDDLREHLLSIVEDDLDGGEGIILIKEADDEGLKEIERQLMNTIDLTSKVEGEAVITNFNNQLYLDMPENVARGLRSGTLEWVDVVDDELKEIVNEYHQCSPKCRDHNKSRKLVGERLADINLMVVERPGIRNDCLVLAELKGFDIEHDDLVNHNQELLHTRLGSEVFEALTNHLRRTRGLVDVVEAN